MCRGFFCRGFFFHNRCRFFCRGLIFRYGRGEVDGIQLDAVVLDAVSVPAVCIGSGGVLVQVGQTGILDIEGADPTVDIGRDADDIVLGQFAFTGDAGGRVNDRFGVDGTGELLQLLIGEHVAGGELG